MEIFNSGSPVYSCAEIREFDRRGVELFGIPGIVLMENAGRALTDTLIATMLKDASSSHILILAGPGNNGGDGFVMARHLRRLSFEVNVLAIGSPGTWKGDANVNLDILEKLVDEKLSLNYFYKENILDSRQKLCSLLEQADIVVDAILGTGSHGIPRFPINEILEMVSSAKKDIFSVDIPSGFDGDSGMAFESAIRANITCTLAAFKKGFAHPNALTYTGKIYLGDIGVSIEKLLMK